MDKVIGAIVSRVSSTVLRQEISSCGLTINRGAVFACVASLIRRPKPFVSVAIHEQSTKSRTDVERSNSAPAASTQALSYITFPRTDASAKTSRVGSRVAAYARTDVSSHYALQ